MAQTTGKLSDMKRFLLIPFVLAIVAQTSLAQSKADTLINKKVPVGSSSPLINSQANPVLLEVLGNRVTSYGSTPIMTEDSLFYANVKVKFGNAAEITLTGHIAIVPPDADPVNYRVDYFVVNRNGTAQVITGTPGVAGLSPNYDPNNQIVVYRWLINNTGTGTVTPVTYATQTQANAGILTNVAMSPNTTVTLIDLKIDEALAGIMSGGSGGHILKYNGTTLTQRAALQVLSDDDLSASPILRDSSSASILDLRDYVSRFGTATGRQLDAFYSVHPDGVYWQTTSGDSYNTTGRMVLEYRGFKTNYVSDRGSAELVVRQDVGNPQINFFVNSRDEVLGENREKLEINMVSNSSGATASIDAYIDPASSFTPTFKGLRYGSHYLSYSLASSDTTYDHYIPDIKLVKDAMAAYGGGGGTTTNSLTPGFGLTGSAFNGAVARTFATDTTLISTHNWVAGQLAGFSPEVQALKRIITLTSNDYADGQVLDVNLALYNTSTSPGLPAWVVTNGSDEGDGTFKFTLIKTGYTSVSAALYDESGSANLSANTTYYASTTVAGGLTTSSISGIEVLRTLAIATNMEVRPRQIVSSGTTTNPLTAGTGVQFNSGTTFNGSAAKTISLSPGAAVANLGFTPVANTITVNGQALSGNVTLTTTNISEGTNLYYTTARFNTAFAGKSTTDLAEGSNLYYTSTRFNTAFSGKSTTDLAEGTNLYFTNSRGIGSMLTGWTSGPGTITSGDNVLQALQKLDGNISAITSSSVRETITQSSHGFTAGKILRRTSGAWAATANTSAAAAEALGVVESATTNTFVIVYSGKVALSGLTDGSNYWVDATGGLTATEPTTSGTVSKPIGVALSSTVLLVQIQRGIVN
jgi:hypothetical protein